MREQHGKLRVVEHGARGAVKNGLAHAAMAVATHHDEIGFGGGRFVDELFTDRPALECDMLLFGPDAVMAEPIGKCFDRRVDRRLLHTRENKDTLRLSEQWKGGGRSACCF